MQCNSLNDSVFCDRSHQAEFITYVSLLSFAMLLPIFRIAECSDDRDRIYPLLGLESLLDPSRTDTIVMPDYSQFTITCCEGFDRHVYHVDFEILLNTRMVFILDLAVWIRYCVRCQNTMINLVVHIS